MSVANEHQFVVVMLQDAVHVASLVEVELVAAVFYLIVIQE